MAFLGEKKTKEEKQAEELQRFIERYGLEAIPPTDLKIIKKIAGDLAGNGLLKAGLTFSFAKAEELAKVTYLSAMVEQNWMIINQLNRLNAGIERLLEDRA